jgi:hypothetical protein
MLRQVPHRPLIAILHLQLTNHQKNQVAKAHSTYSQTHFPPLSPAKHQYQDKKIVA